MTDYKIVPVEPTQEMIDAGRTARTHPAERYKAMLAAAPAVQGEPVAWSLRFRHGDKYERVGPINYMTTFGSRENASIYANRVARDIYGNPAPERRPVVVPLYLHPQPAEQPAPDTLIGRTVSMDVSTGDHDAFRRLFGVVTGVEGRDGVILCELTEDNQDVQPAPDVAALVEALEDINQWVSRWASADHPVAKAARKALAAYRKQGGE